jgi:Protein of unknown function (DUF4058)
MALRDHFRPPLHPLHHWESFHSNWATRIADSLNESWLPREYLAEEHTHAGTHLEIDVATFERGDAASVSRISELVAQTGARRWVPPAPDHVVALAVPDSFEVRVLTDTGGATLVGVIELVSPANKDRPEQRKAFATKCAGFLHQGVSVVLVDVVTTRTANLYNEIVALLGADAARMPDAVSLYGAALRPVLRDDAMQADVWCAPCAVGEALPVLPLRLRGDLFVPVDFESTYQEACRRRRIPGG